MADRDHAAFTTFLAEETIFFAGPKPLHGKDEVAAAWKRFYEPRRRRSRGSRTRSRCSPRDARDQLGARRDPSGKRFATFTSIWRQEAPGVWRIVFDKGNDVCDCAKAPSGRSERG